MELVCEILRPMGFIFHEASSRKEAIEKAGKYLYDLIVMAIMLPGMDGIEATRIIKSKPGYDKTHIIALTAYAMKGDRERFLEEGFDDYISKPIDVAEFTKVVNKYRN